MKRVAMPKRNAEYLQASLFLYLHLQIQKILDGESLASNWVIDEGLNGKM